MALITQEQMGPVRRLTLNTPETLNALSTQMLTALQGIFSELETDLSTRVVILRGAGKAFCAGHNLKEMQAMRESPDRGASALKALFDQCAEMMQTIPRLPQPVIAEVHGIATAAGCQLVASCDLAVAADDTRFGVNGVNIGLFCSTPMVALSRNVARKTAFEMLVTGQFLSAERAQTAGLINRAVPPQDLEVETLELAEIISSKLGAAVKIGKRAFYEQIQLPLDQAYAFTGEAMLENMSLEDTLEGVRAFNEKRDPNWEQ
ncbi:MAG: enoyl-CoA hydratase [Pseudomonadota bacterium]